MKKYLPIGIAILAIAALAGFSFYHKNLRGIGPALKPPPEDITETINTTGMPLKLPAGFSIEIFAKDLENPRVLSRDPAGNIMASITSGGKVVMLPDKNADGKAEETIVLLEDLNRPHGLAIRCTEKCELYVAETDQVKVYDYKYDEARKIHLPVNGRKIIDLPSGRGHFTRTILFMPEPNDNKLLISVGSSCNVCEERDSRRAKILVSSADGSDLKTFASGLRNSVFMTIHPETNKIWATEMGRDLLGDDLPPDEINIIRGPSTSSGQNSIPNFGWPICYGRNIHDTVFDKNTYIRNPCMELFEIPSYIDIPAHSAPLGLAFIPATDAWPEEYHHDLLVAYHGSWNKTEPTGYKIVRFGLDENGNYEGVDSTGSPQVADFITGWLTPDGALGRPVDMLIQPDGTMYVSDDKAGVIYKVWYGEKK